MKLLNLKITWIICGLLIVIGWVLNIIDMVHMPTILSGEGVVRIVGIFFPPLGAFMGWFF